jgi:hypothetical protein
MRGAERKRLGRRSRDSHLSLFTEREFHGVLDREAVRSSRSGKSCLLMLLGIADFEQADKNGFVPELARTLFSVTRETDLKGWWHTGSQIGILFTDVDAPTPAALHEAQRVIKHKILAALRARVGDMAAERIAISWSASPRPSFEAREA